MHMHGFLPHNKRTDLPPQRRPSWVSQPGLVMEAPAPAVSINFFESIGLSKSYSSCVLVRMRER